MFHMNRWFRKKEFQTQGRTCKPKTRVLMSEFSSPSQNREVAKYELFIESKV